MKMYSRRSKTKIKDHALSVPRAHSFGPWQRRCPVDDGSNDGDGDMHAVCMARSALLSSDSREAAWVQLFQ